MNKVVNFSGTLRKSWNQLWSDPFYFIGNFVLVIALHFILTGSLSFGFHTTTFRSLGSFVIGSISSLLLVSIFLNGARGQRISFGQALGFWRLLPGYLGAYILTVLSIMVGLLLLVFPGVYCLLALSLFPFCMVDQNLGAIESLETSWALTKGVKWRLFGWFLIVIGLNILGVLALGVGVLVSAPLSQLILCNLYLTLSGAQKGAEVIDV